MSETSVCSEESHAWTEANFLRLLAALKANIPKDGKMDSYIKGMKSVDWNKVAFPPFSPEECKQTWRKIFQKLRKLRTLTELITDAEGAISNPSDNPKIHPEIPKRPGTPVGFFIGENSAKFQAEHPKMATQKMLTALVKKYDALPDEKKAIYVKKYKLAREEYKRKMVEFREKYYIVPKRNRSQKKEELSENNSHGAVAKSMPSKPPCQGYQLFCKEQGMAGIPKRDFGRVWARRWRALRKSQRDEYNMRSKHLRRQYAVKLNEYLQSFDEEQQQQILVEYGLKIPKEIKDIKSVHKIVRRFPGEPKMPPPCGTSIFFKDKMELLRDEFPDAKERFCIISKLWCDIPTAEKKFYSEIGHRKYSLKLQRWFTTLSADDQEAYQKLNRCKLKYLSAKQLGAGFQKPQRMYTTSDSEDEVLEYSSTDEDDDDDDDDEVLDNEEYEEEEEEEEDEGALTFDMF